MEETEAARGHECEARDGRNILSQDFKPSTKVFPLSSQQRFDIKSIICDDFFSSYKL